MAGTAQVPRRLALHDLDASHHREHRVVAASRAARRRTERLDDLVYEPRATGMTPERAGELSELRPRLEAALRVLPTGTRTVVVLKDVYDWSHPEIAAHLDISVTAAKVRLHRGRKRLRDELWPYMEETS